MERAIFFLAEEKDATLLVLIADDISLKEMDFKGR